MTGTIMPDGTVGLVGGVALKMRAASRSGIKRICIPAFLRFEQQSDGSMVDLFQEAETLGMQIHPVEHISEAYAFLHKLPMPSYPPLNEREICALSPELEKELIDQYQTCLASLQKNYSALSKSEQKELEKSPLYQYLVPDEAVSIFKSGKLFTARDMLLESCIVWEGRKAKDKTLQALIDQNDPMVGKLGSSSSEQILEGIDDYNKYFDKLLNNYNNQFSPEQIQFYPDNDKIREISAQLENPLGIHLVLGKIFYYHFREPISKQQREKIINSEDVSDEVFNQTIENALRMIDYKMVMLKSLEFFWQSESESRIKLVAQLNQIKSNGRAVETSRLFYNGWLAADKSLEVNVIAEIQENKQQTQGQVITQLFLSDPAYASYRYSQKTCMYMYRNIKELGSDLQNKDYQAVASTFASIDMFSRASTLLIKHSVELGMYKDENGNIHYRNSAFLHYLIRTARLHALRNIAECKRLQIPCVAPIKLFEKAEIAREKTNSDKLHDVLKVYWEAGFQAKALVLSFQK